MDGRPAALAAPEPALHVADGGGAGEPAEDPGRRVLAANFGTLGEGTRARIPRLEADPLLRAQRDAVVDHFGTNLKGPFETERVELARAHTAELVSREGGRDPLVVVVDRDALLWTKPRPVAGMVPPVEGVTIAPRPDGGVACFGWIASLHTVAARMWADDGSAFGDFEAFQPDACEGLSAAFAAGIGWIVACSARTGTHAERLRDDATAAWGRQGAALGSGSATAPVALAFDSPSTFMLVERAAAVGGDRLLAFRYDVRDGQPRWPAPIDLGIVGTAPARRLGDRPVASSVRDGAVRVSYPADGGRGPIAVEIASDGRVTRSRP